MFSIRIRKGKDNGRFPYHQQASGSARIGIARVITGRKGGGWRGLQLSKEGFFITLLPISFLEVSEEIVRDGQNPQEVKKTKMRIAMREDYNLNPTSPILPRINSGGVMSVKNQNANSNR